MVVLAASIVSKSGKVVLSRQFREIQRSRIEGLLASFPKLTSTGHQHTTVETEHVRYVYQPLEDLFMVLITNRQSNILQDIESLHLFARVVTDMCRSCDERDILNNSFELLFAFDEIISEGYRENVNLSQVKNNIEMESHEEKIQEIIARNKEREAKEELKRRAKQFDLQRKEASKRGQGFMQGNFSTNTMGGRYSPSLEPSSQSMIQTPSYSGRSSTPPASSSKAKGMQLGRKAKTADLFEAIKTEVEEPLLRPGVAMSRPGSQQKSNPNQESIHVSIEERVSMVANQEGELEQLEVKGVLTLKISDPAMGRIRLSLDAADDPAIQFKTHPNVDKNVFKNEKAVQMRDTSRAFPVNQNLEVVRWKFSSQDETAVPLSITCWPSPADNGTCDVNIEYVLEADHLELRDVIISIPLPGEPNATVHQVDGSYFVDRQRRVLEWQLPLINSNNKNGLLECTLPGSDAAGFFPVMANFVAEKLICGVDVLDVHNLESQSTSIFSKEILLTSDEYTVG
ncbi:coatomer subunit delta [Chlamydoabsidia padenii]|nr:coatomer subunit delta [Chlamydoabsidia padenii]